MLIEIYICIHQYYRKLIRQTGKEWRVTGVHHTDIYYIPYQLMESFSKIAKVFYNKKVFVEIATDTIQTCIENENM